MIYVLTRSAPCFGAAKSRLRWSVTDAWQHQIEQDTAVVAQQRFPVGFQDHFIAISAGMSFVDSQATIYGGLPEKCDA